MKDTQAGIDLAVAQSGDRIEPGEVDIHLIAQNLLTELIETKQKLRDVLCKL